MPKWSIWTQVDFGAFVGCQTPEGRVVGSIGRFQNKDQTTAENVLAASVDILSDARGRWGYEIKPELVDELKVYVNLLQPEEDWVEMEAKDLPGKISSADKWGIFLRLAGGRAATFLPSVWAERPALSAEQLLEMLSEKAGGKKEDWRQAKARLYKTKLIELC